jgi:hypothetical protein
MNYVPSDQKLRQVENAFLYHPPKEDQTDRYVFLRGMARELASAIVSNTPESREQSLALTKLEEVVMWANAAIARNE